jgi:hypothetical protein
MFPFPSLPVPSHWAFAFLENFIVYLFCNYSLSKLQYSLTEVTSLTEI